MCVSFSGVCQSVCSDGVTCSTVNQLSSDEFSIKHRTWRPCFLFFVWIINCDVLAGWSHLGDWQSRTLYYFLQLETSRDFGEQILLMILVDCLNVCVCVCVCAGVCVCACVRASVYVCVFARVHVHARGHTLVSCGLNCS